MKEWNLFIISMGTVLIITSYLMSNPLFNIIGGLLLIGIGIKRFRKDTKDSKGG